MAIDRRATRLGVLALVGVMLFSLLGVRLWFLQTVKAEELQELTTASKTRTVRTPPERGRIFDVEGRILADNQRVLTVAVDWQQLRRKTDRLEIFRRLSAWVNVPVEDMEARFQSNVDSPFLPMPIKQGIDEPTAIALEERSEDFPGLQIIPDWKRVYPYAPARRARHRLHGGDHRGTGRRVPCRRLPAQRTGGAVWHRAKHGVGAPRYLGREGVRGRCEQSPDPLDQGPPADQRLRRAAHDRSRAAAVRRAGDRDHVACPSHPARTPTRGSRSPTASSRR